MIEGTSAATQNIVQKLWNLCNVLRDDGITYQDYVTELTFLVVFKNDARNQARGRSP